MATSIDILGPASWAEYARKDEGLIQVLTFCIMIVNYYKYDDIQFQKPMLFKFIKENIL